MEERRDGHRNPAVMSPEEQKKRGQLAASYEGLSQKFSEIATIIRSGQAITSEEVKGLKEAEMWSEIGLEMAREILNPSSTPESK